MGFQQGLSGLNAASKSLDVIGNNVANASTVGFKESQAQFADVYANSMAGSSGGQAGIGVRVATVAQQFGQGNITSTNNSLDMAVSGSGFFRMDNNGSITYTRNGQFQLDKTGDIVNSQGYHLTGFLPNAAGAIVATTPADIVISTADLLPNPTANITAGLNLDARMAIPAVAPFNANNPLTFNNSTSSTIYDSLGGARTASLYFAKTGVEYLEFISDRGWNTGWRRRVDADDFQFQRGVDSASGSGNFSGIHAGGGRCGSNTQLQLYRHFAIRQHLRCEFAQPGRLRFGSHDRFQHGF